MTVTTDWLEACFQRFNANYFNAQLPLPIFKLSKSRTRLGTMSYKKVRRWGRWQSSDFTIRLTTYYDMTERQAQNVLLHEMIHYYIAYTGQRDTAPHGAVWKGMAETLNRKYGWEIKATTATRGWQVATGIAPVHRPHPENYLVLALRMADGRCFLSVIQPQWATAIEHRLKHVPQLVGHGWYTTADTYFDNFPRCRTLRARQVPPEVYIDKCQTMCSCAV